MHIFKKAQGKKGKHYGNKENLAAKRKRRKLTVRRENHAAEVQNSLRKEKLTARAKIRGVVTKIFQGFFFFAICEAKRINQDGGCQCCRKARIQPPR